MPLKPDDWRAVLDSVWREGFALGVIVGAIVAALLTLALEWWVVG